MVLNIKAAQWKHIRVFDASTLLKEHDALLSIVLHLLPGFLTGALFFALQPLVVAAGYPPHLALVFAIPLAMIPVELGILLYLGYRRNGCLSLRGVVLYCERIPISKYLVYVPLVFAASLVLLGIGASLDNALQTSLFGWMPSLDWGLTGGYSRAALIVTYSLAVLCATLGESVVEELYFRGFLLPRIRYSGRWTTLVHSVLFALYHIWQPWRVVSVAFGILPLVFAARRTRNVYLGMIVHVLLNSWDVIIGVAFILALTSR